MTLQEYIDELCDIAREEGGGIEVVAISDDGEGAGEPYTPVIGVGPGKDGIRRVTVA